MIVHELGMVGWGEMMGKVGEGRFILNHISHPTFYNMCACGQRTVVQNVSLLSSACTHVSM